MRAHATCAPLNGLFNSSVTFTTKGASADRTVSDCPLPAIIWMFTGPAAAAVALNVCGDPLSDPALARTLTGPAAIGVSRTVAYPVSSLTEPPVDRLPLPVTRAHGTCRPA